MVEVSQVMLGLADLEVLEAQEVGGELHLWVQTLPGLEGCPGCGVPAQSNGRREVTLRDVEMGGRPVVLRWRKRLWKCKERLCAVKTWTERHPQLPSRRVLTARAEREIARLLGESPTPTSQAAARFGVTWHTAWAAFTRHAEPAVLARQRELPPPRAAGVDETSFVRRNQTFGSRWCTSIVDVTRRRLLEVVHGRSAQVITDWVDQRPAGWAEQVTVAVCDPLRAYAKGLREAFEHAVLVADFYHVTKAGLDAVDQVRVNVTRETLGRRGRKGDHLYDIRRRLLTAPERLSGPRYARLNARLGHGDPDGHVRQAWRIAHQLRRLNEVGTGRGARRRLDAIIAEAAASDRPELRKLARTLREWRAPICARYDHDRISNAVVEAINTMIKRIKRAGCGYRNFANYRLRLLTLCGKIPVVEPTTTVRLRTRAPRLAA